MEKTTIIAVVLAVVLIAGAVFVSATLPKEEAVAENNVCQPGSGSCDDGNCNNQCGGTCGVPNCGCGK